MTNVGVWGYLIFVSERENDCKVAHKEASSPPPLSRSTPDCEACSVWALKVMGDTCFPSHLPTSSWVAGRGGGSQPPPQRSTKPLVFVSCLEQKKKKKKNHWKGDKTAKFVYRGGKLISEVKGKACMPLKHKKKREKRSSSGLKPCLNNTLNCRSDSQWMSQTIKPLLSYLQDRSVVWVTALYSWLRLHANIGGSLPPCGGRWHLILWWGNRARAVCKVRQNTNHLGNVKSV